jgi:hypothetical protein
MCLSGAIPPKVDIWGLGVTVVECLEELQPEDERREEFTEWKQWYEYLQTCLNQYQHERPFASMVVVDTDQRLTARDLLNVQNPPTNATLNLGVSPLANQANGTTTIYSAAPTPMDWTQTAATAFFQGNPLPTQRNESMQPPQPNPVAIPSPNAPPNRLAQPDARRGGSVKSVRSLNARQKGRKRNGSSQDGRHAPSQSAGVPKRTSSRKRRPKSIHKAQEIQALGMV